MIKQIQLRGISRTPSDKMSEDGGLSESLNMYMDSAENAPAFVPEDKTAELGLPEDLYAERIFIHKTANYENYIVVQSDKVVAYTPGIEDEEPLLVTELAEGEKVNDITSVGNTLIVLTTANLYYILYKDRVYSFLGNKVPMPQIDLYAEKKAIAYKANGRLNFKLNQYQTPDAWNDSSDEDLLSLTEKVWDTDEKSLKKSIIEFLKREGFVSPRFVQYSVELNEGSPMVSLPILVGAGEPFKTYVFADYSRYETEDQVGNIIYDTKITHSIGFNPYSIKAKLRNLSDLEDWRDIITNIKIYISDDLYLLSEYKNEKLRCISIDSTDDGQDLVLQAKFSLDTTMPDMDTMLDMGALTYLCKSIPVTKFSAFSNEVKDLSEGIDIVASEDYLPEKLYEKERLVVGDMTNYPIIPLSSDTYNNRLVAVNNTAILTYTHHGLGSTIVNDESETKYEIYFIAKRPIKDLCFKADIVASLPQYGDLIFCPDQSCYQIVVKAERNDQIRYLSLDAKPHPGLPCSYASIQSLIYNVDDLYNQMSEAQVQLPIINPIDEKDNSLFISPINNPFVFPTEGRFTFQSKVLGVAVATTALSQGQFGQFPLYVFTEDGIWAMETAADGSFVSQKPLSREVCINPDSITSIDNAVVFVTAKGVMMIQGSQVMNISPYMNGRHYTPNESAKDIISKQEGFGDFINAISDEDPFMTFMRDAKVAYDYTGQRLVFISPSNKGFQYVYKIDTQTWHKVAFEGLNLDTPLNSFPECLVMTEPKISQETKTLLHFSSSDISQKAAVIKAFDERLGDLVGLKESKDFIDGTGTLDKDVVGDITSILDELSQEYSFTYTLTEEEKVLTTGDTKIVSLSTILDDSIIQETAKGILITRPFDLGMPDVYKSITDIRVRGYYAKGAVKFILQGSDDGRTFYTLSSLRGKSWKMFRIFILANLDPTERISWIDINFEPRYNTKLR